MPKNIAVLVYNQKWQGDSNHSEVVLFAFIFWSELSSFLISYKFWIDQKKKNTSLHKSTSLQHWLHWGSHPSFFVKYLFEEFCTISTSLLACSSIKILAKVISWHLFLILRFAIVKNNFRRPYPFEVRLAKYFSFK